MTDLAEVWLVRLATGDLSKAAWTADAKVRDMLQLPDGAEWVRFVEAPF
jgi:hypothetical protein